MNNLPVGAILISNGNSMVPSNEAPAGVVAASKTALGMDAKANLNSPALTGVPTAPTASVGTNTTQIATTAFVLANAPTGDYLPLDGSEAMTGDLDMGAKKITNMWPPTDRGHGATKGFVDDALAQSVYVIHPAYRTKSNVKWNNKYLGLSSDMVPFGMTLYTDDTAEDSREFIINENIPAGLYTMRLIHGVASNAGILDVYVGATKVSGSGIDFYTGGASSNATVSEIANVSVPGGSCDFKFKIESKHASSSGHNGHIAAVIFIKE